MRSRPDSLVGCLLGLLVFGCNSEEKCPASRMLVAGQCVRRQGPRPVPPETIPGPCAPGQSRCLEDGRVATCLASADTSTVGTCTHNTRCLEGRCVVDCAPETRLGCASAISELWCNADGMSTRTSTCPADTVGCYDGACQATHVCPPGSTFCVGNELVECDALGFSEKRTLCPDLCARGACTDACGSVDPELGYIGCDFWAVRLENWPDADEQAFGVTLSNATNRRASVTLARGRGSPFSTVSVPAGDLVKVALDQEELPIAHLDAEDAVGLHIVSDQPLTVHQFNPINNVQVFSNDASLILPSNHGGSEFVVLGWPSSMLPEQKAYFTVMALEDGTTRVSLSTPVELIGPASVGTVEAGRSTTLSLRQGEVVSLTAQDPTGVRVTSDKKISVFSANVCANVPFPETGFCDHIEQQLIPTSGWGNTYVLSKFAPRGVEPDVFRILAGDDQTTLTTEPPVPGLDGETLNTGDFIEVVHDASFVLSATGPVQVAQFMVGSGSGCTRIGWDPACHIPRRNECRGSGIGDPAFLTVIATDSFLSEYTFLTPLDYVEDYINVVAHAGSSVTLDGQRLVGEVPIAGDWVLYTQPMGDGVHHLTASRGVGLSVYGYDCDVSYAYPGGLLLR